MSTLEFGSIPCGIGNVNCVRITRDRGFTVTRTHSGRPQNGFVFVQSGAVRFGFVTPEKGITVDAGKMIFIPCGTVYTTTYLQDETHVILAQFDLTYGRLPEALNAPRLLEFYRAEQQMQSLLTHPHPTPTDENRSFYGIYRMYELLWQVVNSLQETSAKFARLFPALSHMQKNFEKQEKVDFYAALCCMSESGFRRLFREYMGMSPIEYRNRQRLEEARKLIGTGEYSVEEAASLVGFANISFFCRSYKKLFGHTPTGRRD